MKLILVLLFSFVLGTVFATTGLDGESNPSDDSVSFRDHVELGQVHWSRDFNKAKTVSKSTGRPLLVLFQEIPGCQTCQNFGKQPLSHPLVVEAIEDLFVPVTVFNNKTGIDQQLLKRFDEPSWNNPVVRFLSPEENDVIARRDRVWSTSGIVQRMRLALKAAGQPIPEYLNLISMPPENQLQTAEFAMHCYWEGEVRLGSIDGVYSTRSGWRDGLEVVQLRFSPAVVSYAKLVETAMEMQCASKVFAHNDQQLKIARQKVGNLAARASGTMRDAKASDQKYYLARTPLRHLPLTEIQATKLNAISKTRKSPLPLLSPRQKEMLKQIAELQSSSPDSLNGLHFPENQNELGNYQMKLLRTIKRSSP